MLPRLITRPCCIPSNLRLKLSHQSLHSTKETIILRQLTSSRSPVTLLIPPSNKSLSRNAAPHLIPPSPPSRPLFSCPPPPRRSRSQPQRCLVSRFLHNTSKVHGKKRRRADSPTSKVPHPQHHNHPPLRPNRHPSRPHRLPLRIPEAGLRRRSRTKGGAGYRVLCGI